MAVAAASFNTSIFWMSCGEMVERPFSTCTPSTIYNGELSPVMDMPPRTRTRTSASGLPSAVVAVTPANLPFNASAAEFIGISFNSFAPTDATEANTSFLFTVW